MVVKPSPYTPLATLLLADAFAAFPPGVVNVVAGGGAVGEALVVSDHTDMVAFTGSTATGRRIGALCADRVKRTHLELGGKDAFIVCDDVDLDVAVPGAAWAAYLNAGQACTSAERFYVFDSVYDEFVERLVAETRGLRLGDPMLPTTDIGPLVAEPQRAKVEAQLAAARTAGGRVLTGGDRGGFERGWYLSPAVVVDADEATPLLTEETFGPVAPVVRVGGLDEAIAGPTPCRTGWARTCTRAGWTTRCAVPRSCAPGRCESTTR